MDTNHSSAAIEARVPLAAGMLAPEFRMPSTADQQVSLSTFRVRPGQPVIVHVDNLNLDLPGKVAAIAQASAQSFSPLPQQNVSGNYTKVEQLQPVKIWLDRSDPRLALGTSVEVRIRVVD